MIQKKNPYSTTKKTQQKKKKKKKNPLNLEKA